MSLSRYLREIHKHKQSDVMRYLQKIRTWEYRQRPKVHRTKPTHIEKARSLGYKAKQGICVYRVRIKRGTKKRDYNNGNTRGKPSNAGIYRIKLQTSLQTRSEMIVGKKMSNMRVLNSYYVGEDGVFKYFEVILVDPHHERIRNDPALNWIVGKKHRECRGLTASGKRGRGINKKSKSNKNIGGSRRKCWKRNNTVTLKTYR